MLQVAGGDGPGEAAEPLTVAQRDAEAAHEARARGVQPRPDRRRGEGCGPVEHRHGQAEPGAGGHHVDHAPQVGVEAAAHVLQVHDHPVEARTGQQPVELGAVEPVGVEDGQPRGPIGVDVVAVPRLARAPVAVLRGDQAAHVDLCGEEGVDPAGEVRGDRGGMGQQTEGAAGQEIRCGEDPIQSGTSM